MTFMMRAMRGWMLGMCALAAMFAAPAPGHAQVTRITEIEIRGNNKINTAAILTVVSTKVGDEASPERLERDRVAIEGLGWFRQVALTIQRVGDGARAIFVVTEFPTVSEFTITGASLYPEAQIRGMLKTKQGQIFNQVDFAADIDAIKKLYSDKGYQANLAFNVDQPDFLEKGILKLEIREMKVGSVVIKWPVRQTKDKEGNVVKEEPHHKTKEYVVKRELKQVPGKLYNQAELHKDYRALTNLGYFETVDPKVEIAENLTVSIIWELTEKRTGQVSVGAGYSPRQQLIGRAELSDSNLRGKGQSVSISGEIGTFGGDGAPSVEVSFHEPWLTKDHTSMSVAIYNKLVYRFSRELQRGAFNPDEDQYFERRFGGQLSFGRPFKWPYTIGLRYDDVNTGDLPRKVNFPQQDGTVIAGNIMRNWDSRDYVQNPTGGHFIRAVNEAGHVSLDSSNTASFDSSFFDKITVDYRRYWRLKGLKATKEPEREQESQKVSVIAARAMVGTTVGNIPFFEQFFVGGAETLRGYLEDRFWGNSMYLASIEYRRPIMKSIVGVLFVDVGDAFGSESVFRFRQKGLRTDFAQHGGIRPFASVGVGLRVATPIGPIRLDFGYGEEGGRTHFSIGHAF
jgi:outer membrane protein insertion porin family